MSDKMVDKISKILNQAERAPEGSPEREAFMETALKLSAAYSIDLTVARAHQAKKERVEEPEKRSFKVGQPSLTTNKNAHFVDLMIMICSHNDVKVTIGGSNMFVHGYGMPSDLEMCERLFALLSVQMLAEADTRLKAGENTEVRLEPKKIRVEIPESRRMWGMHDGSEGGWGDNCANTYDRQDEWIWEDGRRPNMNYTKSYPPPKFELVNVTDADGHLVMEEKRVSISDARIWRVNFYQSFIHALGTRLWEARQEALKAAGVDMQDQADSTAVAIRDKKKEVDDYFKENTKHVLGTYSGAQVNQHSRSGSQAGRDAGQKARLGNEKDLGRQTKEVGR